jgi:hypothetical protein
MRWFLPLLIACQPSDPPAATGVPTDPSDGAAVGGPVAAVALDDHVHDHPAGTTAPDCAKGCAAPTPDETHPLSDDEALEHFAAYAARPADEPSEALETLLFHPRVSRALLDALPDLLPTAHEAFLRHELGRTRVEVAFRLVDDDGAILGQAVRTAPLKEKQHIILEGTGPLKHIEISGKTKRVGLHHLWSRW